MTQGCCADPIKEHEHRKKAGDANRGRKHTPEALKKMREVHTGVKLTSEHRRKIGEGVRGIPKTEEWKRKIGDANKGMHRSEETRRKMRENHADYNGEKNHQWKGGISFEPYCPKFNDEFKERVRIFFGRTCQLCDHIWQPGEKKLAVHHVNYHKDSCCDSSIIPLFVPVCPGSCHTKTGHNRIFWEYWFTEMINHLYGGKCYVDKQMEI